jgi:hypothetical protein
MAEYINSWAISVLSSRTVWWNAANLLLAILSLSEVAAIIPARYLPVQAMVVAIVNLWLRTVTTRPVAFIQPGETKVIQLPKIDPPAPPTITD